MAAGSGVPAAPGPPTSPAVPYPAPYPPPAFVYGPPPWEYQRTEQVGRTKTGLLLLLVGTLLYWLPEVNGLALLASLAGGLVMLVGGILVILGRKAFGPAHGRNVMLSLVFVIVGIVGAFVLGFMVALALLSAAFNPGALAGAVEGAFYTLFIGIFILAAISGIGSVLLFYAIHNKTGKYIVLAGYVTSLALGLVTFALSIGLLTDAIAQIVASGGTDTSALDNLQAQAAALGLLNGIPVVIFTLANYFLWVRFNRGEFATPAGPASPPAMPGMPPGGAIPPIQPR